MMVSLTATAAVLTDKTPAARRVHERCSNLAINQGKLHVKVIHPKHARDGNVPPVYVRSANHRHLINHLVCLHEGKRTHTELLLSSLQKGSQSDSYSGQPSVATGNLQQETDLEVPATNWKTDCLQISLMNTQIFLWKTRVLDIMWGRHRPCLLFAYAKASAIRYATLACYVTDYISAFEKLPVNANVLVKGEDMDERIDVKEKIDKFDHNYKILRLKGLLQSIQTKVFCGFHIKVHPNVSQGCQGGCATCSDYNGCLSCKPKLFFVLERIGMKQIGVCLSSCPSGYYGTRYPDINKCTKCKADCDTCFNKNFCTKCKSGFYLHLGKCLDNCPEGLEANNHTMECVSIVHCEASEWSPWSPCTKKGKTCGFKRGTETRVREIIQHPSAKGNLCPPTSETRKCTVQRKKCQKGERGCGLLIYFASTDLNINIENVSF
ncbi:hypothetical protein DBR06_SOUSAS7510029 [Sousa chinensis]|uniref:R-spondin-3 n=1 Tax=Sousa chinensis TaxID=103600 RepID=A0A484GL05_SOUCH|nr:hypothetical protein DBR06_SOUSAS7510029 [Sousa chinensis]